MGLRRREVDRPGPPPGPSAWTRRSRGASANWSAATGPARRVPEQDSVGQGRAQAAAVAGGDDPDLEPVLPQRRQPPPVRARSAACGNTTGYMVSYLALQDRLGNWGGSASWLRLAAKRQPDGVLVKALAGVAVAEAAGPGCLQLGHRDRRGGEDPKSYVSRILRLALLAPDIVEAILGGWADQRVMTGKTVACAVGGAANTLPYRLIKKKKRDGPTIFRARE